MEERQKALLQLQMKVMTDDPKEDHEVTSRKDLPYKSVTQPPVSHMLKKAEKGHAGSVIGIPKHTKKVMYSHPHSLIDINQRWKMVCGLGKRVKTDNIITD